MHEISGPPLRVCFIGSVSVGKSSLINKLLRCDVCPSSSSAATRCLTRLKYRAQGPLSDQETREIKGRIRENRDNVTRLTFRVFNFDDDPQMRQFKKIEFRDTPGWEDRNGGELDVQATIDFARESDLVLYMLQNSQIASGTWETHLQELVEADPPVRNIVVVLSKSDETEEDYENEDLDPNEFSVEDFIEQRRVAVLSRARHLYSDVISCSTRTNTVGLNQVIRTIKTRLLYPDPDYTLQRMLYQAVDDSSYVPLGVLAAYSKENKWSSSAKLAAGIGAGILGFSAAGLVTTGILLQVIPGLGTAFGGAAILSGLAAFGPGGVLGGIATATTITAASAGVGGLIAGASTSAIVSKIEDKIVKVSAEQKTNIEEYLSSMSKQQVQRSEKKLFNKVESMRSEYYDSIFAQVGNTFFIVFGLFKQFRLLNIISWREFTFQ